MFCFQSNQKPIATNTFIPIEEINSIMSWYTFIVKWTWPIIQKGIDRLEAIQDHIDKKEN